MYPNTIVDPRKVVCFIFRITRGPFFAKVILRMQCEFEKADAILKATFEEMEFDDESASKNQPASPEVQDAFTWWMKNRVVPTAIHHWPMLKPAAVHRLLKANLAIFIEGANEEPS